MFQVYELHRLYRIQKTLMKSIESSSPNGSFSLKNNNQHGNMHQNSRRRLDLEHPADQEYNVAESDHGNRMLEVIDESEIKLTLGPTRYMPRKKHGTPPLTSDSGPSFSSSSTESIRMNRTSSSRSKQKTNTTRNEFSGRELGILQVTDMTLGYQNGSNYNIDLEEQLRQERLKQPPWLFQVLSMNMTWKKKKKIFQSRYD